MAKAANTAEYFSIELKGKSKKFLDIYAKIDDAQQAAKDAREKYGPELIAEAVKSGLVVPAGKEARVIVNRFGGGLQIVIDNPRGAKASKSF